MSGALGCPAEWNTQEAGAQGCSVPGTMCRICKLLLRPHGPRHSQELALSIKLRGWDDLLGKIGALCFACAVFGSIDSAYLKVGQNLKISCELKIV